MTRRTAVTSLVGTGAALQAAAQRKKHVEWRPRLGVLGPYTANNVAWTKNAGFTNMILGAGHRSTLDAATITDTQIDEIKRTLQANEMHVSAFQLTVNHIAPDTSERERTNVYFIKAIELAGKLGVPYIGTASGKNPTLSFEKQVDEVVDTYKRRYFPACERNKVRILWEPWPDGPNLAPARSATMPCSKPSVIPRMSGCNTTPRTWSASLWTPFRPPATTWTKSMTCT
jgi:hypothetical protein